MKAYLCIGVISLGLSGCASHRAAPAISLDAAPEAVRLPDLAKPFSVVEVPQALPLPGQLKWSPHWADPSGESPPAHQDSIPPKAQVAQANSAARIEPARGAFVNATQVWPYSEGALYRVYSSPDRITDVMLQAGEKLLDISAPDTVRWIIGDSTSGSGTSSRVHITLKPTRVNLKSNLAIFTDRRVYYVELEATRETWMASVSWTYPTDRAQSLKAAAEAAEVNAPIAQGLSIERLKFRYDIGGDKPSWRPIRAFDDGEKVYIQFPSGIAQGDLPPLFVIGEKGQADLVNYRVRAPYYIVDRLFGAAELRLGGKNAQRVRITRNDLKALAAPDPAS
jgi:type IV secretion system protein VirB9